MTKYNDGDYYGVVGSYSGLVYLAGSWHKFECGGCMRADGLLKNRLLNGDNPRLVSMFASRTFEYRHNVEKHNNWIKNGKK